MIRVATNSEVEEILAHPRFLEARDAYIAGYLRIYSGDAALNKLLAEAARHVIITFVICLGAASRKNDPDTWLTLAKLQQCVEEHKVGSAGLVEAIVARMLDWGLLAASRPKADRRKRILMPTPQLLKHDRDIIIAQAMATRMVMPSASMALAVQCDPEFQRHFRALSVAAFGPAVEMLARHPEIMTFYKRDSGQMILFSLLSSALSSPEGNLSTITYQEMTVRFGVSRTHARDTVAEAKAAGLVRVIKRGGSKIEITPRLWDATHRFLADAMALFAACGEDSASGLKKRLPS